MINLEEYMAFQFEAEFYNLEPNNPFFTENTIICFDNFFEKYHIFYEENNLLYQLSIAGNDEKSYISVQIKKKNDNNFYSYFANYNRNETVNFLIHNFDNVFGNVKELRYRYLFNNKLKKQIII